MEWQHYNKILNQRINTRSFKDQINGSSAGKCDMTYKIQQTTRRQNHSKRLSLGTNLNQRHVHIIFFLHNDIGLSLGYKLGNKGIGVFWCKVLKSVGEVISNHIHVTSEELELRSSWNEN